MTSPYTQTPLPPSRRHKLRIAYASKRMKRLSKKGLGELMVCVGAEDDCEGDELEENEGRQDEHRGDEDSEEEV